MLGSAIFTIIRVENSNRLPHICTIEKHNLKKLVARLEEEFPDKTITVTEERFTYSIGAIHRFGNVDAADDANFEFMPAR